MMKMTMIVVVALLLCLAIATTLTAAATATATTADCPGNICNAHSFLNTVTELPFVKNEFQSFQINYQEDFTLKKDIDLLVIPFYENKTDSDDKTAKALNFMQTLQSIDSSVESAVKNLLEDNKFSGKVSENIVTRLFQPKEVRYLCIHGLGKEGNSLQAVGKSLAEIALKQNAKTIGIALPAAKFNQDSLQQLLIGMYEGLYKDLRFKLETEAIREDKQKRIKEIQLYGVSSDLINEFKNVEKKASSISSGVQFARDLVGAPANCKTPLSIAEEAKKIAEMPNMKLTILGQVTSPI
jgi:leucyl aminopeptidase